MLRNTANAKPSVQKYLSLSGKYIREGGALLVEGDLFQARGEFWDAAAEIVKAVAAKEGARLRTHNQLWNYLLDLD